MTTPAYDLESVRSEIPLLRTHVPLNNCSQAPQSLRTRRAADAYLASWNESGMDWDLWMGEVEAARAEFAAFIGAEASDVGVATSVSQATSSIASGLTYSNGRRRIVASGAEFPTVGHVWLAQERFGADVRWVPVRRGRVDIADYEAAIDEDTLIVSACRGYYQTGFKQDIEEIARIAHGKGSLLFVDAYQTLGSEPFDAPASGADFVAAGNLKFLMGIPGIAFVWVRPGLADGLRPAVTGWFGRADPFSFDATRLDWGEGARRLDLGTPPVLEAYVARAGMRWLREIGLEEIGAWTAHLGARCVEGAQARGLTVVGPTEPDRKAPTTAILCERSHEVEAALRARNIIVSARGPVIRLAPHFYNTVEDVDDGLDAVARAMGTSA
ncbi:MAG: aminotransferase class V-fold PLP-dependent enzyme [Gemmatimonadetes bacterium]|nr:aminotransferase class V-fold PLP-dependent enzyme [Gemmatimonadota bacterium]